MLLLIRRPLGLTFVIKLLERNEAAGISSYVQKP